MTCPMCLYVMDAFESDCTRCHGKAAARPTAQPPQQVMPPAPPRAPSITVIPKDYSPPARTLSGYMFGSNQGATNHGDMIIRAVAFLVCLLAVGGTISYSINATNGMDFNAMESSQQSAPR